MGLQRELTSTDLACRNWFLCNADAHAGRCLHTRVWCGDPLKGGTADRCTAL